MGACSVLKSISEWEKVTPATGHQRDFLNFHWGGYKDALALQEFHLFCSWVRAG